MKKFFTLPAALLLVVIVFISGCGKGDDNDPDVLQCGAEGNWTSLDVFGMLIYNDLDIVSGNRTFIYEDITTPENICIDESVFARYTVNYMAGGMAGSNITINGKAYFGQSGELVSPILYNANDNLNTVETYLDITPQFSTNPGWVGLQVQFVFPTQGSFTADSLYLHTYVQSIYIQCAYKVAP